MAHEHSVIDLDKHFIIDPATRAIENAELIKNKLMQYDHNSERFTFEITRYIEGHDMMLCNSVEIHYSNVSSSGRGKNSDIYPVSDMDILLDQYGEETDTLMFTWLVSENATQLAGPLNFLIMFECKNNENIVEYRWSTATNVSLSVVSGMNNDAIVSERVPDVLDSWKDEMFREIQTEAMASLDSTVDVVVNEVVDDAITEVNQVDYVTLLVDEWTGESAPYTQTVAVEGITEATEPLLVSALEQSIDISNVEQQEAYLEAYGIVSSGIGTTADGSATFMVYEKPEIDITVGLMNKIFKSTVVGEPGKDGYTPVRGTDYWTEADKTEIINSVISELPVYSGEVVETE